MYKRLLASDKTRYKAVTDLSDLGLGFVKGWQRDHKEELTSVKRMGNKEGIVDLEPYQDPEEK